MAEKKTDILIYGAGIAGLWLFHTLKRSGYDVLLLEKNAIGSGQSIASQGIIHSGLKYTLAGKISPLARSIGAMPDRWRDALKGSGPVDLSPAKNKIFSQNLLIPSGPLGGLVETLGKTALGNTKKIPQSEWPSGIGHSGFNGALMEMGEPVLDIPSVIRALAEPYKNFIRRDNGTKIESALTIYTAAASNHDIATQNGHAAGLETQKRPLLMGLMKNVPFALHAHFVGTSEKPVATITTHKTKDGALVWYVGGAVAERAKDFDPSEVYAAIRKALAKYMPALDLSGIEWAVFPIDRIEGKSKTDGWLPDTPTIHEAGNTLYCWPTKLTFAPLLADMVMKKIENAGIKPSANPNTDWSFLPEADYATAPWDSVEWTKDNSDKQD